MHWTLPICSLGLIGFLTTLSAVLFLGLTCFPEYLLDRLLMLVTGCTEFANQVLMINTARLESAATGALLIMAFDIVVTYLAQILIFQVCIKSTKKY